MIIGMIIGLVKILIPNWIDSIISVSASCMSPIAMLLTGVAISFISLKDTFTNLKIYLLCFVKLIIMPLLFVGITYFFKLPSTVYICSLCILAMPFGLNTIVIPSAAGKDTTVAAGLAVLSHLLSCITIPIVFMVM